MTPAKPKVETVPLDQLAPDPGNARVHGSDNLAAIKASLERFGQVRPLLTTGSGHRDARPAPARDLLPRTPSLVVACVCRRGRLHLVLAQTV